MSGSDLFDLSRRVALVTGGNGGIGLGMARGLTEAGASVAIAGRDYDHQAARVSRCIDEQLPGSACLYSGPPPQPTLPAVRHAIIELFARLTPQRCPHCRKWICDERRRE